MIRKLGRIGQAYHPFHHLMPVMYASVVFALRKNNAFLHSTSKTYHLLVKKAKQKPTHEEDAPEINVAIGQTARKLHASKTKYCMPASLKEEVTSIQKMLMDEDVSFSTPISHIIQHHGPDVI